MSIFYAILVLICTWWFVYLLHRHTNLFMKKDEESAYKGYIEGMKKAYNKEQKKK
jgi:hypothetical protein